MQRFISCILCQNKCFKIKIKNLHQKGESWHREKLAWQAKQVIAQTGGKQTSTQKASQQTSQQAGANSGNVLPITPYCVPSSDQHSTSLPENVHSLCYTAPTVTDLIVAGSRFPGEMNVPVATYDNFLQGLLTRPAAKETGKPKKKATARVTSGQMSDATDDYLSAYIDMSQNQITLIRSQFNSI